MKKKVLTMALVVMMCIASVGLFAADLWDQADSIADGSVNILPAVTEVTYTETNEFGIAVATQNALETMSESRTGRLTYRFYGSDQLQELMHSYSDGLIFTPFNESAEDFDECEATGEIAQINGEACEEYYYEVSVDESAVFYNVNDDESGDTIDFSGYVWISTDTGAPLKIENSYSLGFLDVTQTTFFELADGEIVPELIVTEGSTYSTEGAYGMLEQTDFVIEEVVNEVFEASSYNG